MENRMGSYTEIDSLVLTAPFHQVDDKPRYDVGSVYERTDFAKYVYCMAGNDLAIGDGAKVIATSQQNNTVTVYGKRTLEMPTDIDFAANAYQWGWITINGGIYKIAGSTKGNGYAVFLHLYDDIFTAAVRDTITNCDLLPNRAWGVISMGPASDASETDIDFVGVALNAIPANKYGWLQMRGLAAVGMGTVWLR